MTDAKHKTAADAKHKTAADVPLGTLGEVSSVYIGLSLACVDIGSALNSFRSAEVEVERVKRLCNAYNEVHCARQQLEVVEKDLRKLVERFDPR